MKHPNNVFITKILRQNYLVYQFSCTPFISTKKSHHKLLSFHLLIVKPYTLL